MSKIVFTEPIKKSDQMRLKQQEYFPKEEMKGTQSTTDLETKEVVIQ